MAGTMVHLLVAQLLFPILKEYKYVFQEDLTIRQDFFVAGNVCPDGIMARKGYTRSMKLHSHFRDGIPDGTFDQPGMVPLFEQRMKSFWSGHLPQEKECAGLYLGYITHMMTDEKFILEERPKFFQNIGKTGLTQKDVETFLIFNEETDLVDFQLIRSYPQLQEARKILEKVPKYEIKGMITKEELTQSRQWILQHFFGQDHPLKEAKYLEYTSMVKFIQEIVEEISSRLLEEGYMKKKT